MVRKIQKIYSAFTKTEKKIFLSSLSVATLSAVLLTFLFVGEATEVVAGFGGDYVEGIVGQPTYVNPVIATNEIDKSLIRLIFSNLHDLAAKIDVDKNGRVWNVRLKEGVFWHDGKELTSDDVIFTIQKIQDLDSRSPLFQSWQGVVTERLSEREIQFNLGIPYAFFSTNLENLYILPQHLFGDIPVANWRISDFNLKPVGTGPYQFDSYEIRPDGFISVYRLRANPIYFGDRPYIPELKLALFPSKKELIGAFNAGQSDGLAGLELDDLKEVQRPYEISRFNLPNYYGVFFNQSQHIALKEKEVREALSLAIDKRALIQEVFSDFAVIARGPIPSILGYPEIDAEIVSSQEAANKLLEEAGWKLGEEGVRQKTIKQTSIDFEVNLVVPQASFLVKTGTFLERAWENLGIKVNLTVLPIEDVLDPIIKNREYQMILFGNILNVGPDLFSFWHSSERFFPGLNLSLYSNENVDRLIESSRQNFDEETRKEQIRELQQLIAEDYAAIFLYSPDYFFLGTKEIRGIDAGMLIEPADRFLGIQNWYLKTRRVFK